jgi:phosphatidylglycerophosphate synthase
MGPSSTCSGLYSVSSLLDALDGYAARYLDQSTSFGACLDMVVGLPSASLSFEHKGLD